MKLTTEVKLIAGIILITLALVITGIFYFSSPRAAFTREQMVPPYSHTRGEVNAKTYLVEFSDFQCSACKSFKPVAEAIVAKNKDKLVLVYRHFPLTKHIFAQSSAWAAEAAGEQGKFWEMYEYLFKNQENLSESIINEGIKSLNLDEKKYNEDYNSNKIKEKVDRDLRDGYKFGVDGTPTFYLNGNKLKLSSYQDLIDKVEAEINKN